MPRFVLRVVLLATALLPHLAAPAPAQAPPSPFQVDAEIAPAVSPLGTELRLSATVTNVSDAEATFGHDGCPVWFDIDGVYQPYIGCPEFWRRVTLEPGESITFGPAEYPYLVHAPADYPLGPGRHRVSVRVGDAGGTVVGLGVESPLPDRTYLSGRITDFRGDPVPGAVVEFIADAPDSFGGPPSEIHRTLTRDGGWFFLGGIRPNEFRMRVTGPADRVVWWPGVTDPSAAQPIRAPGGVYRDGLDLRLGGDPAPPSAFVGGVIEETLLAVVIPVAGAEVVAVPLPSDALDPALDLTDVQPEYRPPFRTTTDENGRFVLPVDPGAYRLLAGKPDGYGYRWAPHAAAWDEGQVYVIADGRQEAVSLAIPPRETLGEAGIAGQVLGYDPVTDGPPEPLDQVVVGGHPLLSFPHYRFAAVKTGPDGRYRLPVLAATPWFVHFHRSDYQGEFWPTGPAAEPVDVQPDTTTGGIDMVLQPAFRPGDGAIDGLVYRVDDPCGGHEDCLAPSVRVPVAGALVRVTAAFPTFAPYELLARTDENGYFRVDGLWADAQGTLSYYVSAETRDHAPVYYPGGVPFDLAEPLPVFPGQVVSAGTLLFDAPGVPGGGFLVGIVLDEAGVPVDGAVVRYRVEAAAGPRTFVARSARGGHWTLPDLPHPAEGILSVEKEGWIPAYAGPNASPVFRWDHAERIVTWPAGDPLFDPFPIGLVLPAVRGSGPYLQAGRVQAEAALRTDDPEGDLGAASLTPRLRALQLHVRNVSRAFFYLVNPQAAGPTEAVVAGGVTSDNGTVIVTDLPAGVYHAYADKPGFERDYFRSEAGNPVLLVLGPSTPAVLAEIVLQPVRRKDVGAGDPPVTALLNEPNPFHAQDTTTLYYRLLADQPVTVTVFDVRGREVNRLLEGAFRPAGEHTVTWDGTDAAGRRMSAGVYVYRVDAGGSSSARKMVLLP